MRFTRHSYTTSYKTILVPWNKMVVMETVVLHREGSKSELSNHICSHILSVNSIDIQLINSENIRKKGKQKEEEKEEEEENDDEKECDIVHDVYNLQPEVHTRWSYEKGAGFQYALVNRMVVIKDF